MIFFSPPPAAATAQNYPGFLVYKVRKSDTLWSIGRRYGISARELARLNGIDDPTSLQVGAELKICADNEAFFNKNFPLSRGVRPGKWRYIVIHHSATDTGSVRAFDYYHRKRLHMKRGLAYHFIIGNGNGMKDGEIAMGSRWQYQQPGGHLNSLQQNEISLGVCLVGNYQNDRPTDKQLNSLIALVRYLQEKFSVPRRRILGHREMPDAHTVCPGKLFPLGKLRLSLLQ